MSKRWTRGDVLLLVFSLLVTLAIGFIGSRLTAISVSTWYFDLIKPSFTPPSSWFALVWTVLYILMGISLFLIWRQNTNTHNVRMALKWFIVQLLLGLVWNFVFFYLQSPFLGLIMIILLWISIIKTIQAAALASPLASFLLYPYQIWVTFAAVLNASIWWLNR